MYFPTELLRFQFSLNSLSTYCICSTMLDVFTCNVLFHSHNFLKRQSPFDRWLNWGRLPQIERVKARSIPVGCTDLELGALVIATKITFLTQMHIAAISQNSRSYKGALSGHLGLWVWEKVLFRDVDMAKPIQDALFWMTVDECRS